MHPQSRNTDCFYNIVHTWGRASLPTCLCFVQVSSCNFKEEQQQEGRGNQGRLPKDERDEGSHSSGQRIKDYAAFPQE